jgi:hypothetical protein
MITIELPKAGLEFQLPESANELTEKMLHLVGDLVWQPMDEKEKSISFLVEIGKLFYLKKVKNIDWELIGSQIIQHDLIDKLNWLWDEKKGTYLLPELNVDGVRFIAPGNEMGSMTVLEWAKADEAFFDWLENHSADKLAELCGILFRRNGQGNAFDRFHKDFKGDEREPFNVHILEHYAAIGETFPEAIQRLIAWQYYCNRSWLIDEFEDVFDGGGDGDGSVYEMMLGLSGQTFGTLTDVQQSPLIDVLVYMNKQVKDAEKIELQRLKQNV